MTTWKTTVRAAFAVVLLLCGAIASSRADFLYDITLNTSGQTGTTGQLDLQFNPSGGSSNVTATVQNLLGNDAMFGAITYNAGAVTGPGNTNPPTGLPLFFTANNNTGYAINEVTMNVTYGSNLALQVAITTPDTASTASLFVTAFDANSNVISPSTDPSGASIVLNMAAQPSGNPTISTVVGSEATATPAFSVPEPSLGFLLAQGLVCLGLVGVILRRKRVSKAS